jgi:hypothetical protein
LPSSAAQLFSVLWIGSGMSLIRTCMLGFWTHSASPEHGAKLFPLCKYFPCCLLTPLFKGCMILCRG